jgi:hypothetical protein
MRFSTFSLDSFSVWGTCIRLSGGGQHYEDRADEFVDFGVLLEVLELFLDQLVLILLFHELLPACNCFLHLLLKILELLLALLKLLLDDLNLLSH